MSGLDLWQLERGEGAHILVVDGDEENRRHLQAVLDDGGYVTLGTADVEEALRIAEARPPHLVLIHLTPDIADCRALCLGLRGERDEASLPILVLIDYDTPALLEHAVEAGASDFIAKPVHWPLLTQRIRHNLRHAAEHRELIARQEQLLEAQRIARLGYWTLDVGQNRVRVSEGFAEMMTLPPRESYAFEELLGQVHPDDMDAVLDAFGRCIDHKEPYQLEHRMLPADGEELTLIQRGEYQEQGDQARILGTIQDVTELRAARAELAYRDLYDPLTGLPSRRSLELLVEHQTAHAPDDALFAVLFIGLDRFSRVNAALGKSGGDQVLRCLGERLRSLMGGGHEVARCAGDVFGVLLRGLHHIDQCDRHIDDILACIRRPVEVGGREVYLTASIGVGLYPLESEEAAELIAGAESAMVQSRRAGGNRATYRTAQHHRATRRRIELEEALRRALARDEFRVHYQPQVCAGSGRVIGMEALVRWQHPERGLLEPAEFVPAAEETGMIVEIGERVLRQAARDTRRWLDQGHPLRVGVNLSAQQFAGDGLLPLVRGVLEESGLPAEALELEVTESMAMEDVEAAVVKLTELRELGVHTSMDDFGTGYSSLAQLQRLPLNTLKVDQAFVRSICQGDHCDGESGAIASAVIAMSHSLGLDVIAEGVETENQQHFLERSGSEILQGYLFGRPMPAEAFEALLGRQPAGGGVC